MKTVLHVAMFASAVALAGCSWDTGDPSTAVHPSGQSTAPLAANDGGAGSMNHSGGGDARDSGHNPDPGAFGASCSSGSDCESNVCFMGAKGGSCSLNCTSDSECPPGEDGTEHCNPHGYCRY